MKVIIDGRQLTYLMAMAVIGTVFFPLPGVLADLAGVDATLAGFASFALTAPFVYITIKLFQRFPGKHLVEILRQVLGPLGWLVGLAYSATLLFFSSLILRQMAMVYQMDAFANTPQFFFLATLLLLFGYALAHGIEVVARLNEITIWVILTGLGVLLFLSLPFMSLDEFQPILAEGYLPLVHPFPFLMAYMGEALLILGALIPTIKKVPEIANATWKGLTLGVFTLMLVVIATEGVFGAAEMTRFFYATLALAKILEVGDIARGVESFLLIPWTIAGFFKFLLLGYAGMTGFSKLFRLKSERPLIIPAMLLLLGLSFIPRDALQLIDLFDLVDLWIILPMATGLPLLLLALAWIRGLPKGEKPS